MDCPFTLPPAGQEIYREVFDAAKERGDTDMQAAGKAWKAVKFVYRKKGDRWIKKKAPKTKHAARGRLITVRG